MEKIINTILKQNTTLFGINPKVEKINVGFTNTIYSIDDYFMVKICTNSNNENAFQKEIEFYKTNKTNNLIPKMYYSSTDKKDIPYFYEIIEKIDGVSLYNVWHTFNEEQRLLDYTYTKFGNYLKSNDFVLIHNDLHFDNIFFNDGKIKLIDFERSMYAPRDFELDILYRMIRKPWKFASEETEPYTNLSDYSKIMSYIEKYYPELVNIPNLYKRLAIYDIVYFLKHLIQHLDIEELKNDVLFATKKVALKDEIN